MQTISIGTISVVMSDYHSSETHITDQLGDELSDAFVSYFNHKLRQYNLENVVVLESKWYRGCITIVITIGIAVTAVGGLLALQKFLKEYKDTREGLDKLIKDIKNVAVRVKRLFAAKKQNDPAEQLPAAPPAEEEKRIFQVMFEEAVKQYETLSPGQKKYFTAGQQIVFYNEKEKTFSKFVLSVMRTDLATDEEITSTVNAIDKGS